MNRSRSRIFTLLVRPDCPLCEEFEEELKAQPGAEHFEIRSADVDSRDDWRQRFGRSIPVLLNERGDVVCETRFDPAALSRLLA